MVSIKPKSPELVQAQVAAFTNETVDDVLSRVHILKHLAHIADDNPTVVMRPPSVEEGLKGVPRHYVDGVVLPAILAADNNNYKNYLSHNLPDKKVELERRAEIIKNYGKFAPEIAALKARLSQTQNDVSDTDFLAAGGYSRVFLIHHEGTPYAVRIPYESNSVDHVDLHVAAAAIANGTPHVENIVAASYEEGVTVAELMPGTSLSNLEPKVFAAINDTQLREMVRTIQRMNQIGLMADFQGQGNILYDPEDGFGFVDIVAADSAGTTIFHEIKEYMINEPEQFAYHVYTASHETTDTHYEQTAIILLERYSDILIEESKKGPSLSESLRQIKIMISYLEENIDRSSDFI